MNRNFHNLRGSSVNPTPRWRNVFIALVLVLTIGSAGPTSTALAAPAGVSAFFSMEVTNPKTTLRCKETVTYSVVVRAVPSPLPTPSPASIGLPRGIFIVTVEIFGESTNTPVGNFVGPGTIRTAVSLDSELITLSAAKFKFKAGKPGKTTLKFDAYVGTEIVSAELEVKVLPCKFKVNTVTKIIAGMTSVGIMDAEMESDEQGNFTGAATVNWVTSMLCGIASPIDPGTADLTGTISESGQLVGEVTFGPMTSVGGGSCGVSVSTSNFGTLDPLTIKASSEGVSVYTQAQAIHATNGSFTGTTTIVVIPEEEEAVSFIPDNRETGWRVFLSLFGALLDLH